MDTDQVTSGQSATTSRMMKEPNVQELVAVITNIMKPQKRADLHLNLHHQTQLIGSKSKKQLSRKRKTTKCKTLSRKQNAELGLYTLPTKSIRYVDMLPLHQLWTEYMWNHLSLSEETKAPRVDEPGYESFSKLLVKSDLHGAIVTVTRSRCPGLVGVTGIVTMDTKNTFKIVSKDNRLRTIPKQDSVFQIVVANLEFTIFGKHLTIRSAERSVKKIKNFMELDL